jgi:hypothetical protein
LSISGIFRLFCGLLHSDPAVVGRKSGSPKMADADICTTDVSEISTVASLLLKSEELSYWIAVRKYFSIL